MRGFQGEPSVAHRGEGNAESWRDVVDRLFDGRGFEELEVGRVLAKLGRGVVESLHEFDAFKGWKPFADKVEYLGREAPD